VVAQQLANPQSTDWMDVEADESGEDELEDEMLWRQNDAALGVRIPDIDESQLHITGRQAAEAAGRV
jgi:hypothetical protein